MLLIRNLLAVIILTFSLSACSEMRYLFGYDDPVLDFPPGEYIGTAKLLVPGEEEETVEEVAEAAPAVDSSDTAEAEVAGQGEAASAEIKIEPPKLGKNYKPVKLTFLPKAQSIKDGVGVLTLENSSQRFYWRSDGNNKDTWNLLFSKDNNVYTNLKINFSFDGIVRSSELENSIEGKLHVDRDEQISDYFIEAFQFFDPEIIPPKETLTGAGGTNVDITVAKVGEDPEAYKVLMISKLDKENQKVMEVASVKPAKEAGQKLLSLTLEKGIEKGEYWITIIRTGRNREFRSNKIPFTIK